MEHEILDMLIKMNNNIELMRADIESLKSDVATLKSDVVTLKSDVATLKSDVVTNEDSMNSRFEEVMLRLKITNNKLDNLSLDTKYEFRKVNNNIFALQDEMETVIAVLTQNNMLVAKN